MKNGHIAGTLVAVTFTLAAISAMAQDLDTADIPASADAAGSSVVDIPGVGRIDLNKLPPELRDNIRIPGVVDEEPEQPYQDLPPLPNVDLDEAPKPNVEVSSEEMVLPTPDSSGNDAELEELREKSKAWREEQQKAAEEHFNEVRSRMPEDAYIKALEHTHQMQPGQPVAVPTPEPQSWLIGPRQWFASVWGSWSLPPAYGQSAQCTGAAPWVSIGPAGWRLNGSNGNGPAGHGAGRIRYVAVDPQDSRRIYLGTQNGGLWKTTNGTDNEPTWTATTDNLSYPNKTSLQIEAIAVHPSNSNVIMAGTGHGGAVGYDADQTVFNKSVGMFRSTDGGSTWAQIGPTWCAPTDPLACRSGNTCIASDPTQCPGTDPTLSTLTIKEVRIDSSQRVWAATSKGLWYSDNAAKTPLPPANQVKWTLVTPPGSCGNPATCLPVQADNVTPEMVNQFFVNGLNNSILYAGVGESGVGGHKGWYKSTSHDGAPGTWAKVNGTGQNVLPADPVVERSAFLAGSSTGTQDILYSIILNVPSPKCGPNSLNTRIYKTTDSGTNWKLLDFAGGVPNDPDCYDGPTSIQVDPLNSTTIVFGGVRLNRALNAGLSNQTVAEIGAGIVHADHSALTFDPDTINHPHILFDGNDGGIWKGDPTTFPEVWTNIHSNLANVEFYGGDADRLNYAVSLGGTQDNGEEKGGSPPQWAEVKEGDGGLLALIDPTNSNVAYFSGYYTTLQKTTDGGRSFLTKTDGTGGLPNPVNVIALDPIDHNTLVAYSLSANKVYRTTTAAQTWLPISPQFSSSAPVTSFAIAQAPPSNLIFAGTQGNGLLRTTDAVGWPRIDQGQLPTRKLTSIAIDATTQPCNATSCTLYVTAYDLDDDVPGQVFRSTDSGATWRNISGCDKQTHICPSGASCLSAPCPAGDGMPDVPANQVVIHPACPNVVYVGTDAGVFQGTLNNGNCGTVNNGTWAWCPYTNGFPQTAPVKSLVVLPDAGILRAITYGRSVWDAQAFTPPNPDQKANPTPPATGVLSPRVDSGKSVQNYSMAWVDDRLGANNWHVYFRGFGYDVNGQSTPLSSDFRVDDTTAHRAQMPSVSQIRTLNNLAIAKVAWMDNRNYCTDPPTCSSVINNIFYNHVLSSGSKLFYIDQQADQSLNNLSATSPAVAYLANLNVAVSWQVDRMAGSNQPQDVYLRFFNSAGTPYAGQCKVSTNTASATSPAIASNASDSSVYVAWSESDTITAKVFINRYDGVGNCMVGSVMNVNCGSTPGNCLHTPSLLLSDGTSGVSRSQPAISIDDSGNVVVAWWERIGAAPEMIVAKRCNSALDPTSCTFLDAQCRMECAESTNVNATCTSDADCTGGGHCTSRKCGPGPNYGSACVAATDCPGATCGSPSVSCPPLAPIGAQEATLATVATDSAGNIATYWQGAVNDPSPVLSPAWSTFACSFSSTLGLLKNDFRIDLAGHVAAVQPGVARGRKECVGGTNQGKLCQVDSDCPGSTCAASGKFAFVWKDQRNGHYDAYTRVVRVR